MTDGCWTYLDLADLMSVISLEPLVVMGEAVPANVRDSAFSEARPETTYNLADVCCCRWLTDNPIDAKLRHAPQRERFPGPVGFQAGTLVQRFEGDERR